MSKNVDLYNILILRSIDVITSFDCIVNIDVIVNIRWIVLEVLMLLYFFLILIEKDC